MNGALEPPILELRQIRKRMKCREALRGMKRCEALRGMKCCEIPVTNADVNVAWARLYIGDLNA